MDNKFITVYNEEGNPVQLELIDVVKVDNSEYIIAGPKNSNEACAYKVINRSNGEVEYKSIGVGKEFDKVLEKYNS